MLYLSPQRGHIGSSFIFSKVRCRFSVLLLLLLLLPMYWLRWHCHVKEASHNHQLAKKNRQKRW